MHLREPTKCFYAVRELMLRQTQAETPEELLWQEVILCAIQDYYRVGCAQKKEDEADARDYLHYRLWHGIEVEIFDLDRDWFLKIVEEGKEKAEAAWEAEGN